LVDNQVNSITEQRTNTEKLTGSCGADIICAISVANGLSAAGATLDPPALVVAVVDVTSGATGIAEPDDVVLEPLVTGGMNGNARPPPPLNIHTHDGLIYSLQI